MKKNVSNATLICVVLFLFSQCKKDSNDALKKEGVKRGEIVLSTAELSIVPYVVNDSAIFKDSLGSLHIFKVLSRNKNLERIYKDGAMDISTDYYDIENLTVILSDNNGFDIEIDLKALLPSYCSNQNINKNYFLVSFYPPNNSTPAISYNCFGNYIDSTDFYYSFPDGLSIPYHNVFTILNKTFNSVYELTRPRPVQSNDYIQTAYYTKSKGIIGFKMKSGVSWYLDN